MNQVVKKPILSEKAYQLMKNGIYSFVVTDAARKENIAKEIEFQFGVKVAKVNIAKSAPKAKRIAKTRKFAKVGGGKKAIVFLEKGQIIAALAPKQESKSKSKKEPDKKEEKKGK